MTVMSEQNFCEYFSHLTLKPSSLRLKTYTGEALRVVGEADLEVSHGNQGPKTLTLAVVAGNGPPLLGRNWLQHFVLKCPKIKSILLTNESLHRLLQDYVDVFRDDLGTITPFKATLSVSPSANPRFHRPQPVPYALRPLVEQELERLERAGVLQPVSHSDWAAPVPKCDGTVRICGDYKLTVNPVLDVDQYPLPRSDDLFATLGGKYFSTMDLSHAYNQLSLDDHARQFLTINTHRGLYEYTRLPFGVASAPSLFQKTMDTILQGIDGVICYLDDILVSGRTEEEQLENLRKVLQRLQEHGIRPKKSKCVFLKTSVQTSVRYLGHVIDANGLHATDDKVKAIVNAPRPKNVAELRSFLGLLQYYGRFIPNLSSLLYPLNQLLQHQQNWRWTKACREAFRAAKEMIASSRVLTHYDSNLPIRLATVASAYGVGAVISHVLDDGSEHPIAFASRTLQSSERNYAQIEKEALSLVFGVCKFHPYLYGRRFTLVTDHKPLTTILGPKKGVPPIAVARLQRWALKLAAYSYDIEFRSTENHANADVLSRVPLHHTDPLGYTSEPSIFNLQQIGSLPVTANKVAAATRYDKELSRIY